MSDQHVTRETLARLQRRELPPDELMPALLHLGSCPDCIGHVEAGDVDAVRRAIVSGADRGESEHLDPATQLIPYVDAVLDPAEVEIVESHVDDCAMCRRELEDLLLQREPRRSSRAWMIALAAAIAAIVVAIAAFVGRTDPETIAPRVIKVIAPPAIETRGPTARTHRYDNAQWEKLVVDAVTQKRLTFPATRGELSPAPDVLRNSGEIAGGGLSPAGVVLEDARPELAWKSSDGATYTVSVYDGETEVVRSEPLKGSRWRPARALPRGRTLAWQVEVARGNDLQILPAPPAPPALFRIITENEQRELREAVTNFPSEHLLHAVLYARAGLRSNATDALRRAAASGDGDARAMLEGPGVGRGTR